MHGRQHAPPPVRLGHVERDSVAVNVYVLVRQAAQERPELATALRGRISLRFEEDYAPVRIDLRGDALEVADAAGDDADEYDVELSGRLGDITALIAAPQAAGLPNPMTSRGRGAILRLADGRVNVAGSLVLARDALRLLAIEPVRAA